MKKRLLPPIVTVCLSMGCVSTTVTIEPFPAESAVSQAFAREYPSVWDALKCLDFAAAERMNPTEDQRAFSHSLQALVSGDPSAARNGFQEILTLSTDQTASAAAFEVLCQILFQEHRWTELLAIKEKQPPDQDQSFWVLPQAYCGLPPETVDFPATPISLPLSLTYMGNPIVDVEVNGHSRKFWIDTGAGVTVVSADVAKECGIESLGGAEAGATGAAGRVAATPAVIREISIGGITFHDHPTIIIKNEDMELKILGFLTLIKIDGIIGWPAIKRLKATIDYSGRTITLEKPVARPMKECTLFSPGFPVAKARSTDGADLYFGIDTGANSSFIQDALLSKLKGAETVPKKAHEMGVGGWKQIDVKQLKEISIVIGASLLRIKNIGTGYLKTTPFILLDGTLGADAMKGTCVTIDYTNGVFDLRIPKG